MKTVCKCAFCLSVYEIQGRNFDISALTVGCNFYQSRRGIALVETNFNCANLNTVKIRPAPLLCPSFRCHLRHVLLGLLLTIFWYDLCTTGGESSGPKRYFAKHRHPTFNFFFIVTSF